MKNSRLNLALFVANIAAIGFSLNVLPAVAIGKIANSHSITTENFLPRQKISQTCRNRSYSRISTRQLEQLLNCMEIRYQRERDNRNPVYNIDLGDSDVTLLALDDCNRYGCRNLILLAVFESDRSPSESRIRQWNRTSNGRKARADIDDSDQVILRSTVSLEDGADSEEIMDVIDNFQTSISRFIRYMGF